MIEAKVWAVGVGNLPGTIPGSWRRKKRRAALKALKIAKGQDGFIGVYPAPPRGTLILYRTENDAKRARNALEAEGVLCGRNIGEVFIDERYLSKEGQG